MLPIVLHAFHMSRPSVALGARFSPRSQREEIDIRFRGEQKIALTTICPLISHAIYSHPGNNVQIQLSRVETKHPPPSCQSISRHAVIGRMIPLRAADALQPQLFHRVPERWTRTTQERVAGWLFKVVYRSVFKVPWNHAF